MSREVVLSLHSVHNVKHTPEESYYGMATNHTAEAEVPVTSARPAKLMVHLESIVSLRVFLHARGRPSSEDRPVGQVSVPIREMLEICGPCIFQTWLLLDPWSAYGSQIRSQVAERFRRAFAEVSVELHSPRICISLMEASVEPSQWTSSEKDRALYHDPLLVSHAQHLQAVKAYLDHCDREHLEVRAASKRSSEDPQSQLDKTQRQLEEEETRLRVQLDNITEEANRRIEKGNEHILKLTAQLKDLQEKEEPELEQQRQEALAALQRQRQKAKEVQKQAEGTSAVLRQLQDEVQLLQEQKEALVVAVQEIYSKQKATVTPSTSIAEVKDRLLPDPL